MVTFRLRAPEAKSVLLRASWAGGEIAMAKDAEGLWSVTVGPVEPDIYSYTFAVDGLHIVDPSNPQVKLWQGGATSLVEVPAEEPTWYDWREAPHGDLHVHYYESSVTPTPRRLFVYTPPGYEQKTDQSYAVLYLLHGSGDDESTWTTVGHANLILDNLIAAGDAEPMIVVMTNGHPIPYGQRSPENRGQNTALFRQELTADVMPYVAKRYRLRPDRESRAIAGLSMGGGQALNVGLGRPDLFAWVGAFSSGAPDTNDETLLKFLEDPAAADLELLWIAVGEDDFLLDRNRAFRKALEEGGVEHVYQETPGDHSWPVWRRYLKEFAPLLFQTP